MHRHARTFRRPSHAPANSSMPNLDAINRFHILSKDRPLNLPPHMLLDRLTLLAENLFASVPDPFSFVRFRRVVGPNIGGYLAHHLFVDSFDQKLRVFLNGYLDPIRNRKNHRMRESDA